MNTMHAVKVANPNGYSLAHNDIVLWKYFSDLKVRIIYHTFFTTAKYYETTDKFNNKIGAYEISTSRSEIAEYHDLTINQVDVVLIKLRNDNMIRTRSLGKRGLIVSLLDPGAHKFTSQFPKAFEEDQLVYVNEEKELAQEENQKVQAIAGGAQDLIGFNKDGLLNIKAAQIKKAAQPADAIQPSLRNLITGQEKDQHNKTPVEKQAINIKKCKKKQPHANKDLRDELKPYLSQLYQPYGRWRKKSAKSLANAKYALIALLSQEKDRDGVMEKIILSFNMYLQYSKTFDLPWVKSFHAYIPVALERIEGMINKGFKYEPHVKNPAQAVEDEFYQEEERIKTQCDETYSELEGDEKESIDERANTLRCADKYPKPIKAYIRKIIADDLGLVNDYKEPPRSDKGTLDRHKEIEEGKT